MKNKELLIRLKALVVVLNCAVAALSFINLYTITSGAIRVDIPDKDDFTWEVDLEQKLLVFKGNFTVSNHGFYDITDVDITAVLRDEEGNILIGYRQNDLEIPAGDVQKFDIVAVLPFKNVGPNRILELVLHDSKFYLDVDVRAIYMWGLSTFTVDETVVYPWVAAIKQVHNWLLNLTIGDMIGYARNLNDGDWNLPLDWSKLNGFNVSFAFDIDPFDTTLVKLFVNIMFEDEFLAGVEFTYTLEEGWNYNISQGVVQ